MSDIKFYEKVSSEIEQSDSYIELKKILREKTNSIDGTIYVTQIPLYNVEDDNSTELMDNNNNSFVILIPETKIIFTSITDINSTEFEDYVGEFIDSVTTLSGVFGFKSKIGNSRKWNHLLDEIPINEINIDKINSRKVIEQDSLATLEILISLISGSINTPDKGGRSQSILEAVRRRIVQFDGDQTRFIYDDVPKKKVTIQGLAGTGKTELLFHRLVNLYNQTDKKIVFTCNSKILANDIKKRLPKFFDQMKVSRREDIDERIKVMRSWGSQYEPKSGLYSFICNFYGLDFISYSESGSEKFDGVCLSAIRQIEEKISNQEFTYCFDYILIDEAQDFSDSFFRLCELVASTQVIVASDIFQTIYERKSELVQTPDFTLNKVYRTDPKNFMFSQFLGFGLKEKPVIQWFDTDESWRASGYTFEKNEIDHTTVYEFSREPINRFNDFREETVVPTELKYVEDTRKVLTQVIEIIDDLREKHEDIAPSDIGIVFISKSNDGYQLADNISTVIEQKYNWGTQKIYENRYKSRRKDKVFISNQNNVKGLEFSFLIGIVFDEITQDVESRNTIYMLMTRSFLTSYLILGNSNRIIYEKYQPMLEEILETGKVKIVKPQKEDILQEEQIQNLLSGSLTFDQKIERALRNKKLFTFEKSQKIKKTVEAMLGNNGISLQQIEELIEGNRDYLDE